MKKALFCALILTASSAMAQDSGSSSPYAFGGACSSQGVWTANALQSTQSLRKITLALKDDPNCQALGTSMQNALANLESQLERSNAGQEPARTRRLSQIPNEIAALRTYYSSNSSMKSQVMALLMNRAVEGAALSATIGSSAPDAKAAELMRDFGQRTNESAKVGMKVFNQVVDTLPQLDQCLTKDGTQMVGNMVAGLVQVATSFASSGSDTTGGRMAETISKLSTYMRNSHFSSVLRKLNETEFQASMACLVELTSESYCNARDAMGLFEKGMADLNWKSEINDKIVAGNPFVGYYVLNTHVPNITQWMQKIQIGVDPMLPTDAVFQNKIQQEVTDFYKGLKTLLGDYNSSLLTIKSLPNLEAKQNQVLKLIQNISESMLRGGGSGGYSTEDKTNFFTMSKTPIKIPFFLIGMDQVPDQVLGRAQGLMKISYDDWLQANMSSMKEFQDPEKLAETIGINMRELAQSANASVIEYFSKWYIVDKTRLVNEALTDVNYNVKDSLIATRQYLEIAKDHINKYHGEEAKLTMIMESQVQIDKVLAKFEEFAALGKSFRAKSKAENLTAEDIERSSEIAAELIKTVYDQFVVMQARSGFLANRLVDIVRYDYILLINNRVDFSEYQQDIFTATGMAGLDRMLQMFNGNPANIKSDLNMALDLNKKNLDALEYLMKDNLIRIIAEKKLISEDRNDSLTATARDSMGRLITDVRTAQNKFLGFETDNWLTKLAVVPAVVPKVIGYWWAHSDRYPLEPGRRSPESEFKDASALYSQLCVQALAFYNQNSIFELCGKAILSSPFKNLKSHDMSYEARVRGHLDNTKASPAMRKAWNYSDRICAFRDYNRKNLVRFMSLNKKEKQAFISEQKAEQKGEIEE